MDQKSQKQEKESKGKPVRFHKVLELMESIVKSHTQDTVRFSSKKKRSLHHFFHKEDYKHSPLEQLFYSEDIFTKEGCMEFIQILKLMQKKGVKKANLASLNINEKKKIGAEIMNLENLLSAFEKNPDMLSPYIRDRYVALSFKEDIG